ncbi:MAG: alanine racemase [Methylohalobius sp.]|nr:alanine racemase [Methylohalobius sp.]
MTVQCPYALLDLDALRANLARVRVLAPRSKVLAVVKANAYGHGLEEIAHALRAADGFAVARVEEAIALRRAHVLQRIVVLSGFWDSDQLTACIHFRLEPVIHNLAQIELLANCSGAKSLRVWLKLDSGMHRLGLAPEEFPQVLAQVTSLLGPRAVTLMTHLACADEFGDCTTQAQLALFERLTAGLEAERSIANSAAILAWPRAHADWVRPGLMLYGVSPFAGRQAQELGLTPVMTLKSRVIALKAVAKGEAVGYGRGWTAPRPSRLGIVAAGYGDGYPREVALDTKVLVEGQPAPVVGRVSMDLISVDLTDLPQVRIGSEVTLWGEGLPVEHLACQAGTIPYTLLCRVAARVPRVIKQVNRDARQSCL